MLRKHIKVNSPENRHFVIQLDESFFGVEKGGEQRTVSLERRITSGHSWLRQHCFLSVCDPLGCKWCLSHLLLLEKY